MASQTQKGKAFEFACLKALQERLCQTQKVIAVSNHAYAIAKGFYEDADAVDPIIMDQAAKAAVKIIIRLEPLLENPDGNAPLYLSIQEDAKGIAGDVRDVICIRRQNHWEIGLSCKHNHAALKHSRLSSTIDFGSQWFGKPCSAGYFGNVVPLFNELRGLQANGILWRDIENKDTRFYCPILDAFVAEVNRLDAAYPNEIPPALLRYLIGRNDFYKVMTNDTQRTTQIQAYNLNSSLNKPAGSIQPAIRVQQLKLPARIIEIRYKDSSSNTVIFTCDHGWSVSFRIHNASSRVEPSLKFDVQLEGSPPMLHSQTEPWE